MSALVLLCWLLSAVIVIGLPLLAWRQGRRGWQPGLRIRLVQKVAVCAVVLLAALAARVRPDDVGLGLAEPLRLLSVSAVAAAALIAVDLASTRLLLSRPDLIRRQLGALSGWADRKRAEPLVLAAFILAAAVYEEILFRGFGFMLAERFGVAPLLALIPLSLAFGFQHLASGFGGVAYACFFGLLYSLIYLATGSLYPAIAAHAAGNSFTIFYTQPRLERRLALDAQPAFLF